MPGMKEKREFEERFCLRDGLHRRAIASEVRPTHQPAPRNGQRLADQGSSQSSVLERFENEFAGPAGIAKVTRQKGVEMEVRTEAALDCQRKLKLVRPKHYPPTHGQRGQFDPGFW